MSGTGRLVRRAWTPHVLLGVVLFGVYATLSVARYVSFRSRSWDLAIFEQVVRAYAHFQAPVATLKGPDFNILGDHFSPVTALIGPLYRLFPSPITLLLVQAALFAVSAAVVSDTAALFLGRVRGLLIGAAYGLSWGIQRAVDFDFHEICFAVPLLAVALRQFLKGNWRRAAYWSLPLVFVKEDLGLTVAGLGLCLFLARQRALGAGLAAWGVAATATSLLVVVPMFNPSDGYDYWKKVSGDETASASLLGQLVEASGTKTETLLWIVGVTAFLALRSPLLLMVVPTLGWRFLSAESSYWGTDWHYNAILMPIVFAALIDAIRNAPSSPRAWVRSYARNTVPAVVAVAVVLSFQLPVRDLLKPATYDGGKRAAAAHEAVSRIPDGVTVEANTGLMTHLTGRTTVYWVGNTGSLTPQYIALDLASGWSARPTDLVAYAGRLHPSSRYELVFQGEDYAVLALRGRA
jgi:uncharacterized membrane protein